MSNQTTKVDPVMSTYSRFPITLSKGKGSYVWDDHEVKYLDYTSGLATCNLGHVPDVVYEQVKSQLNNLWHCSNLYHIPAQEKLAEKLVENSCGDQVFFCNSGAEANEAAIKLARKYAADHHGEHKKEIITFTNSFHGRTLATLSATGQAKIQHGFTPLLEGFRYLAYNDVEALKLVQPTTCAVMLELVQGEGGVVPADKEWLNQLVSICQANDILIIVDEIQTGMGRTGALFAYQQYEIEPDIITVAKGLGSGVPIGAMLAKEYVAKSFSPGTHGSTFGGNPVAATAGLATLTHLVESTVLDNAKEMSSYLMGGLAKLVEKYDDIEAVRGKGLMIGMVVKGNAIDYIHAAREKQILIVVAGPNVVRILPPLTTTKEEVDHFLVIMDQVFSA
ncbi:acetylornithine transaminase [Aquibacillus salsiterrae]|uniref:Acetylornithine aminotransferase n=1 Tax=Aquibacillus salsiterrae TaxID=2950439 RepID=A0A9X3WEB6_9BACI|nr:acetylornithine transaminase [Aquibacillus salsiterrae]MDC3416886.1 acetylornithine transaminase [Aquibacillus salsiterrae]